jgi:hypothetical protein
MKVVVTNCSRQIPSLGTYFGEHQYNTSRPETKEDFFVRDGDVEFDIRMRSYNGFYIPVDCDVDMEIKFTIIPKPQSPTIKTFK